MRSRMIRTPKEMSPKKTGKTTGATETKIRRTRTTRRCLKTRNIGKGRMARTIRKRRKRIRRKVRKVK